MNKRRYLYCLAALLLVLCAGCKAESAAEETPVNLGVRIPWTPAPSQEPAEGPAEGPENTGGQPEGWTKETLAEAGVGQRVLRRGMQGADVLQVQRRLTELGYLDGEADGVYGRLTIDAVAQFQRDSGLEKVDGKTGEETLERLFGAELMPRPTPTPTPTARPTATPAPTPTPTPMPRATAVPSAEGAPFDVVQKDIYIGETKTALMLGKADGQTIYPLCGIQMHRGYTCTASGGVWEMAAPSGGTVTLIAGEEDGRLDGAMGAVDDTLLLCDAPVYVYGSEVWVPAAVLSQIGLHIVELEEASVIW